MNFARGIWHWLSSRAVRRAVDQHRIVRRLYAFQQDRLPQEGQGEVKAALDDLRHRLAIAESVQAVADSTARLQTTAERWLDGLPRRAHRELAEVLVIGCAAVLGIRTFFVQPMTIPTGSMQPTLFGVTVEGPRRGADMAIPQGLERFIHQVYYGKRYFHFVAETAGRLTSIGQVEPALRWLPMATWWRKQDFVVGDTTYRIWSPPIEIPNPFPIPQDQALFGHARLRANRLYHPGDTLMKLVVTAGDRVLVDRFTPNFRRPRRGDIVVFKTTGIDGTQQRTHYLKRLVALGGETVRIGDDRHVVIDGVRLDAGTPGFERVYSFSGPPRDSEYSGHINDATAREHRMPGDAVAPRFPNGKAEFKVRPNHLFVLGDNTVSSLDGRRWGDFPREHVVGRFWMVYWPISPRFGWTVR